MTAASNSPLLTIAVPTYNRAASLRRSLPALIHQIDAIPGGWDDVELLVSDNCSTDETPSVVQAIAANAPVSYVRNAENLGMEGNFISCFKRARGRYVWTFSDDDLLADQSMVAIIELLKTQAVDLVYVPARSFHAELDTFSSTPVDFSLLRVSGDMVALRANGMLSFLSSVIVNKVSYFSLRSGDTLLRYQGTFLAHYEWIYTLLAHGSNYYMCNRPVIQARSGAAGGYDVFQVFCSHYVRIGRELLADKPRMRRDLELGMLYIHLPGFIFRCRSNSLGSFRFIPEEAARQILNAYGDSLFYRLVLRTQLFGTPRSAAIAYTASRLIARVWGGIRRFSANGSHLSQR